MAIELTPSAARRIQQQLKQRGHGVGLRLGISKTGCSGYGYKLNYAEQVSEDDTVFDQHGATLVVRSEDLKLLDGLRVDFRREGLNEVFRFDNPNAKALCGCGESFTV